MGGRGRKRGRASQVNAEVSFDGPEDREAISMRVVKELRNREVRFGGEEHEGWLPPRASRPPQTPVELVRLDFEIQATEGGYLLIWEGTERRHCGDTWHSTVGDAVDQAKLWFGIEPHEWSPV